MNNEWGARIAMWIYLIASIGCFFAMTYGFLREIRKGHDNV